MDMKSVRRGDEKVRKEREGGTVYDFSPSDRFLLLNHLPREGSYASLLLLREFRESLSFSEFEHQDLDIKEVDDGNGGTVISWNPKAVSNKGIRIGPVILGQIRKTLQQLDSRGKLNDDLISLYERFVINGQ
jgi:hypothetical protein